MLKLKNYWKKFTKMEEQSNANQAEFGSGSKPFVGVLKPDGTTDGLVMFRISDIENVVTESGFTISNKKIPSNPCKLCIFYAMP